MSKVTIGIVAAAVSLSLAGCAEEPLGPTIPVMPGPDKPFAAFQDDQYYCEDYARDRVAGRVNAENDRIARHTIVGALLGAALGAAVGNPRGTGAAIGGAAGAAVGASTAHPGSGRYDTQRAYDYAYAQCMDYRGNRLPPPYGPPPGYHQQDRGYPQPGYQRQDRRDYPPPPDGYRPDDDDDD